MAQSATLGLSASRTCIDQEADPIFWLGRRSPVDQPLDSSAINPNATDVPPSPPSPTVDEGSVEEVGPRLIDGPIGVTLVRLAVPMAVGIAALMLFQLVDTFYVGMLGSSELAAMGFAMPVTLFVMHVALGLGVGATAVVSRAIGAGDRGRVRRLTTDTLVLANVIVVVVALSGVLSLRSLFSLLGAPPAIVDLVAGYMVPWYLGVGLLVIPMVGNSAIRAAGDTKSPMVIMVVAGVANAVLDPLLIFGLGPFPRLELTGAALATVISWASAFVMTSWVLVRREKMVTFELPRASDVLRSWRAVLHVGGPSTVTQLMQPLGAGAITRLVAEFGPDAVAGYAVGARIDALALVGVFALSAVSSPFVGQNLGAGRTDRIAAGLRFLVLACLGWGIAMLVLLLGFSAPISRAFSAEPSVLEASTTYLRVLPLSYGLLGIATVVGSVLNPLGRPFLSTGLAAFRFGLGLTGAFIGMSLGGLTGMFVGLATGFGVSGAVAWVVIAPLAYGRASRDDTLMPDARCPETFAE